MAYLVGLLLLLYPLLGLAINGVVYVDVVGSFLAVKDSGVQHPRELGLDEVNVIRE